MSELIFFNVIIAVYNGEKFIAKTLESVLNQTYRHFDVTVVDDSSSDQTVTLVKQYCKQDSRIKLFRNKNNLGPCHARNYGVAHAQGNWIAICDQDDLWATQKLQVQANFIENWKGEEPLVALGTSGHTINEKDKVIAPLASFPNTLAEFKQHRESCEPFILHHTSTVFIKDLFLQIGGYRDDYVAGAEDCDLFTRLSDIGVVINIEQPLLFYRKHLGSLMFKNTIAQFNDMQRIKENTFRRRKGMDEISHEQFLKQIEENMTKEEKKLQFQRQKGKFLYRIGGINFTNGRYISGMYYLILAMFCDRSLVLSGLKNTAKFKSALFFTFIGKKLTYQEFINLTNQRDKS
jgi:glycosyltransferase involved in cell wall biosynthesis